MVPATTRIKSLIPLHENDSASASNIHVIFSTDPDEMLVFAEAGTGLVGFVGGVDNAKYILGRSSRPVAVGYDPIEQVGTTS